MTRLVDRQPDLEDQLNEISGPHSRRPMSAAQIESLASRRQALVDYFGGIATQQETKIIAPAHSVEG